MTKPSRKPDTFASDYIPPHAVTCWVDETAVYCAIPALSGPPLINRYPLTEAGLSKALDVLRKSRDLALRHGKAAPARKASPVVTKIEKVKADDATREQARAVLKKMGII